MKQLTQERIHQAIGHFKFEGTPYGSGHINDTFLLSYEIGEMGRLKVILQRMNNEVFGKPVELMENIMNVTSYLKERIAENGGDPERETLRTQREITGGPTSLSQALPAMTRWRSRRTSTRAPWLLGTSSACWRISRRRHSMRPLRASTIREHALPCLSRR